MALVIITLAMMVLVMSSVDYIGLYDIDDYDTGDDCVVEDGTGECR